MGLFFIAGTVPANIPTNIVVAHFNVEMKNPGAGKGWLVLVRSAVNASELVG
jgi:hypothetical protein